MKISDLKDDKKFISRKISFCHHFGERKKNYENDRSVKNLRERDRKRVSECVCVCVRERERERERKREREREGGSERERVLT
jgi:hypothetical protein